MISTRWSQVLAAGRGDAAAHSALAWLCSAYWQPLLEHVRRRGYGEADAEDLTQDFLLAVIEGGIVERADRARGRFRTFLLACLDHHLGHARERSAAQKRGGGVRHVGLECEQGMVDDPLAFDREWAESVLARAVDRLRAGDEDGQRLEALLPFLTTNGDAAAYGAVGQRLGLALSAVRVAVHRLRRRYAEAVRAEVAETLHNPDQQAIDNEISDLLAAVGQKSR